MKNNYGGIQVTLSEYEKEVRKEAKRFHEEQFEETGDVKHLNWLIREELENEQED